VSDLINQFRQSFKDEEYRYAYAESFMNSYVAAQIKILREKNYPTQQALADEIGTKQAGISRLENVNYSSWKVETLRKLARAFGVRLKISFEEFGSLPREVDDFKRESLMREPFDSDPIFSPQPLPAVAQTIELPAMVATNEEFASIPTFEEELNAVAATTAPPAAHGDLAEGNIIGSATAIITGVCATAQAGQVSAGMAEVLVSDQFGGGLLRPNIMPQADEAPPMLLLPNGTGLPAQAFGAGAQ
jgi:transcriptional regulator with XRE-family HTH domain